MAFKCSLPTCQKDVEGGTCSQCKMAHYCCEEHQRSHWKDHKGMCKEIAATRREEQVLSRAWPNLLLAGSAPSRHQSCS